MAPLYCGDSKLATARRTFSARLRYLSLDACAPSVIDFSTCGRPNAGFSSSSISRTMFSQQATDPCSSRNCSLSTAKCRRSTMVPSPLSNRSGSYRANAKYFAFRLLSRFSNFEINRALTLPLLNSELPLEFKFFTLVVQTNDFVKRVRLAQRSRRSYSRCRALS
ncbi:MAG: hypothetical protein ACI915_002750 [Gammaproteobacteria bacterium]|jgi:hypothetical protein